MSACALQAAPLGRTIVDPGDRAGVQPLAPPQLQVLARSHKQRRQRARAVGDEGRGRRQSFRPGCAHTASTAGGAIHSPRATDETGAPECPTARGRRSGAERFGCFNGHDRPAIGQQPVIQWTNAHIPTHLPFVARAAWIEEGANAYGVHVG